MANEPILVSCEQCGKKYKIDPAKMEDDELIFNCTGCQKAITVHKPSGTEETTPPPPESPAEESAPEPEAQQPPAEAAAPLPDDEDKAGKKRLLGLRGKMAILFLVIPIVLMALAGFTYLYQMDKMVTVFRDSSSQIVERLSGEILAQASRSVALQVKKHLEENPFLRRENFNRDKDFKLVAVQKIGMTGYTYLYALPDSSNTWRIWAHVDPDLPGKDMNELKSKLGAGFDDFKNIFSAVAGGRAARGTYSWTEDGERRSRFVVATPVIGTDYVVMASMPAEEFTRDVTRLATRTGKVADETRNAILLILAGTLLLIAVIVALYGARLTSRIKALTQAANQISVGEMDTEIKVDSYDEIGDLAEAISRMQESIRLSIERLRRRRRRG
ncbi:MAG: HAMP domain-containing protein [Deltaproteobacteria bacterium]|nr:HAMP domain-containing protein [Deltaproteobacteria bacterium]